MPHELPAFRALCDPNSPKHLAPSNDSLKCFLVSPCFTQNCLSFCGEIQSFAPQKSTPRCCCYATQAQCGDQQCGPQGLQQLLATHRAADERCKRLVAGPWRFQEWQVGLIMALYHVISMIELSHYQ